MISSNYFRKKKLYNKYQNGGRPLRDNVTGIIIDYNKKPVEGRTETGLPLVVLSNAPNFNSNYNFDNNIIGKSIEDNPIYINKNDGLAYEKVNRNGVDHYFPHYNNEEFFKDTGNSSYKDDVSVIYNNKDLPGAYGISNVMTEPDSNAITQFVQYLNGERKKVDKYGKPILESTSQTQVSSAENESLSTNSVTTGETNAALASGDSSSTAVKAESTSTENTSQIQVEEQSTLTPEQKVKLETAYTAAMKEIPEVTDGDLSDEQEAIVTNNFVKTVIEEMGGKEQIAKEHNIEEFQVEDFIIKSFDKVFPSPNLSSGNLTQDSQDNTSPVFNNTNASNNDAIANEHSPNSQVTQEEGIDYNNTSTQQNNNNTSNIQNVSFNNFESVDDIIKNNSLTADNLNDFLQQHKDQITYFTAKSLTDKIFNTNERQRVDNFGQIYFDPNTDRPEKLTDAEYPIYNTLKEILQTDIDAMDYSNFYNHFKWSPEVITQIKEDTDIKKIQQEIKTAADNKDYTTYYNKIKELNRKMWKHIDPSGRITSSYEEEGENPRFYFFDGPYGKRAAEINSSASSIIEGIKQLTDELTVPITNETSMMADLQDLNIGTKVINNPHTTTTGTNQTNVNKTNKNIDISTFAITNKQDPAIIKIFKNKGIGDISTMTDTQISDIIKRKMNERLDVSKVNRIPIKEGEKIIGYKASIYDNNVPLKTALSTYSNAKSEYVIFELEGEDANRKTVGASEYTEVTANKGDFTSELKTNILGGNLLMDTDIQFTTYKAPKIKMINAGAKKAYNSSSSDYFNIMSFSNMKDKKGNDILFIIPEDDSLPTELKKFIADIKAYNNLEVINTVNSPDLFNKVVTQLKEYIATKAELDMLKAMEQISYEIDEPYNSTDVIQQAIDCLINPNSNCFPDKTKKEKETPSTQFNLPERKKSKRININLGSEKRQYGGYVKDNYYRRSLYATGGKLYRTAGLLDVTGKVGKNKSNTVLTSSVSLVPEKPINNVSPISTADLPPITVLGINPIHALKKQNMQLYYYLLQERQKMQKMEQEKIKQEKKEKEKEKQEKDIKNNNKKEQPFSIFVNTKQI